MRGAMAKYKTGDHVKIEVKDESSPIGEWMWMLVEDRTTKSG
jgi:hypothetical protein